MKSLARDKRSRLFVHNVKDKSKRFWFKRVPGRGLEQIEPNKMAVLCLQLVMISGLGEKLQCRGLRPLYEVLEHGGSEGVE